MHPRIVVLQTTALLLRHEVKTDAGPGCWASDRGLPTPFHVLSRPRDLNPQPGVHKTPALPLSQSGKMYGGSLVPTPQRVHRCVLPYAP